MAVERLCKTHGIKMVPYEMENGTHYSCPRPGCVMRSFRGHEHEVTDELSEIRGRCHRKFDAIWKRGGITRRAAYNRLAHMMGIPTAACHFRVFTVEQFEEALRHIRKIKKAKTGKP